MKESYLPEEDNGIMDRDDQMILSLLTALASEPNTTQKDLATRLGVAVGLVNSYLKRVIYKGYVKTKQLERRRLRYLLTPAGIREKTRLTYEFLRYSYQYIREVRRNVSQAMLPFARDGKKRVIFYGSGDVAELAYLAVRELGMDLVAVIDPDNVGKRCVDHVVQDAARLETNGCADVLLILDTTSSQRDGENDIERLTQRLQIECVTCV